jgi:hypothetical protein
MIIISAVVGAVIFMVGVATGHAMTRDRVDITKFDGDAIHQNNFN